jgi:hypothetical protein
MHWAAAWRAVRQLVSSPFMWEKTPHRAMPRLAHVTPTRQASRATAIVSTAQIWRIGRR